MTGWVGGGPDDGDIVRRLRGRLGGWSESVDDGWLNGRLDGWLDGGTDEGRIDAGWLGNFMRHGRVMDEDGSDKLMHG